MYNIVRPVTSHTVQQEHQFGSATIADWVQFCSEAMLDYVQGCSQKMISSNNTVEMDESEFVLRKYNRSQAVNGQ